MNPNRKRLPTTSAMARADDVTACYGKPIEPRSPDRAAGA